MAAGCSGVTAGAAASAAVAGLAATVSAVAVVSADVLVAAASGAADSGVVADSSIQPGRMWPLQRLQLLKHQAGREHCLALLPLKPDQEAPGISPAALPLKPRPTARELFSAIPLLARAREFAGDGHVTGASGRNWASYGHDVQLAATLSEVDKALLTDPQTSGGLLVSCAADTVTEVLSIFLQQGFSHVSVIGEVVAGEPAIMVS